MTKLTVEGARVRIKCMRLWGLVGALVFSFASPAYAGGLWLHEFGAPSQGRINAGAHSGVDDASTALFNPAAMSRIESSQLLVGGSVLSSSAEFDVERSSPVNGSGDGGDAGGVAPAASLFYVRPLNDKWHAGVSLAGITGASLDYDNDWAGRFQTQEVALLGLALMPAVSYAVTDKLSLGFGVPVLYTTLDMDIAIPVPDGGGGVSEGRASIDGDDVEVATQFSATYKLSEHSQIGLIYSSEFEPSYSGDVKIQAGREVAVNTDLVLAQRLYAGYSHNLQNDWTLHLSMGYEDWSAMEDVFLSGESNGVVLSRNWKDTWHTAVGVDYQMASQWNLTAGFSYDSNPVDKEDRTADMPVDRQIRIAAGAVYTRPSGLEIASSLVYADLGESKIDSTGFGGEYSSNELLVLAVSAHWRF